MFYLVNGRWAAAEPVGGLGLMVGESVGWWPVVLVAGLIIHL